MLNRNQIGKQYPDFSFEVEKGKIREFARAIGDNNPVYFDQGSAKKEGFQSFVAPPTFVNLYYTTSLDSHVLYIPNTYSKFVLFSSLGDIGFAVGKNRHDGYVRCLWIR